MENLETCPHCHKSLKPEPKIGVREAVAALLSALSHLDGGKGHPVTVAMSSLRQALDDEPDWKEWVRNLTRGHGSDSDENTFATLREIRNARRLLEEWS